MGIRKGGLLILFGEVVYDGEYEAYNNLEKKL